MNGLIVCCLLAALSAAEAPAVPESPVDTEAPVSTKAPDDFDAFFKEFAAKRAGVQVLEADITERSIEFGEESRRKGRVLFGQPRRIIFRYESDQPTVMVDDRRVYEYDPLEEQLQIFDVEDSPEASVFFLGFDGDARAVREAYDVRLFTTQNEAGKHGITIQPFKENIDFAPFQEVTIHLRDADYLPFQIRIKLDDDTYMVTEFSNYTINKPVEASRTQLRIPAETRIIENDAVVMDAVPAGGMLVPPTALTVPGGNVPTTEAPVESVTLPGESVTVEVLPAP